MAYWMYRERDGQGDSGAKIDRARKKTKL